MLARDRTLSGTVKDTAGQPLAGAKVRLFSTTGPRDQGYQLVSASGTHLFENVPPGDYEVSTVDFHSVKDAPPEKRKRITIEPGETIEVRLQP